MKAKLIKVDDIYRLLREDNLIIGTTDKEYQKAFSDHCDLLSLKNCQAIENGYDLDELAVECMKNTINQETGSDTHRLSLMLGFKKGFQKALEILGDKKFTEEDMIRLFDLGFNTGVGWENGEDKINLKEHIQSLQTEWDVEVVEQCLDPNCDGINRKGDCVTTGKLKLDADGCLILKRVV